jgi:predicted amidohydrolase
MNLAIVAVQLELDLDALASGAALRARIDDAAAAALAAAAPAAHRLLVFPEALGHLAPLALGPAAARRARTVDDALAAAALRRPWSVARGLLGARTPSPTHAVLHALAPDADRWMRDTFAALARRHAATVVAGSHLRIRGDGSIANSSFTFDPAGRLVATTDKVNLVPGLEDRRRGGLGLSRGDPGAVPVVEAGWGRLATLICYDGFAEPHTRHERFARVAPRLDAAGVDVIANPAANPWPWHQGWIHAEPDEHLLRAEQWQREGLPATLQTLRHCRWGVTAHLVARVLDLRFEGASEILRRDGDRVVAVARAPHHDRGGHVSWSVP